MTDIINLPHSGLIRIAGNDAKTFLQGQLTSDLNEISPKHSSLGAHCNPQGRVISLFWLCQFDEAYLLHMPKSLIPIAIKALKKYSVFYKTTLEDVSAEYFQYGVMNNSIHPPANTSIITLFPPLSRSIMLSKKPQPGVDSNEWHLINIQTGIPTLYPETSEKFLPHELNLPALHAVSFKKGCYTGQEIIARMEYRGKIKQHLCQAEALTDHLPPRGSDIYSQGKPCGNIVDFVEIGYNHYLLQIIAPDAIPLALDPEEKIMLKR